MPAPCLSTPTAPSVSTTPNPSSTWGALPPVSVPSLPTSLLLSRLTSAPFLCTPALPALHELSPHFARKKCLPAFVQEHRWSLKHHMDRPSSKTVKYNHFYPPALRGATHPCSNSQTPHARVGPWRRGSPRLAGSLPPSRSLNRGSVVHLVDLLHTRVALGSPVHTHLSLYPLIHLCGQVQALWTAF